MTVLPWQRQEFTFRQSGSVRFTEEQRSAYALYVDVEIVSFVHQKYESLNSLPNNSFWGKVTTFQGAVPTKVENVVFSKQRMFSYVGRENLNASLIGNSHYAQIDTIFEFAEGVNVFLLPDPVIYPTVLGVPETVIKFKALPLSQFRMVIHWLEYEPAFGDAINIQSEDPTDGEDEYPEPVRNSPDNPYFNNPPPSFPDEDSDPQDFDPDNLENFPREVWFEVDVVYSNGVGQPNNCTLNTPATEIVSWNLAGPPPYTVELAGLSSPCAGFTSGFRIRDSQNNTSPVYAPLATTGVAELIDFFYFEPSP